MRHKVTSCSHSDVSNNGETVAGLAKGQLCHKHSTWNVPTRRHNLFAECFVYILSCKAGSG